MASNATHCDALSYKGVWSTTYAANLRQLLASMTRGDWIKYAKSTETRPPIPWFTLRAISENDLSVTYEYMKALVSEVRRCQLTCRRGNSLRGQWCSFRSDRALAISLQFSGL